LMSRSNQTSGVTSGDRRSSEAHGPFWTATDCLVIEA
jgi:hypothetical protein